MKSFTEIAQLSGRKKRVIYDWVRQNRISTNEQFVSHRRNCFLSDQDAERFLLYARSARRISPCQDYTLSDKQMNIVVGSLLGDGYLTKLTRKEMSSFRKTQTAAHKPYLDWHFDELLPLSAGFSARKAKTEYRQGKLWRSNPSYEFYTYSAYALAELRKKWYPEGTKIVPPDLKLNPLTLAVWYCDDGCNKTGKRWMTLATLAFTVDECEFLVERLRTDLNVIAYISMHSGKPLVCISSHSYLDFMKIVSPYIPWQCMRRKTDLTNYIPPYKPGIGMICPNANLTEEQVMSILHLHFSQGVKQKKICEQLGLKMYTVNNIVRGKSYRYFYDRFFRTNQELLAQPNSSQAA